MAKMKLFGLLFSFFNLLLMSWTPILASNEMEPARLEQCNLPAPDSFRITQVGGDFIKLAWNPIFPGAQHQLIIMESDGNGGYVTILVENNVSGDTYNANNLLPGTGYRFVIATKCASGDPSEIKSIIDGITLIVDLAIEGRKPALAGTVEICGFIPMNYNWKGFRISGIEEGQYYENYFEIVPQLIPVVSSNNLNKIQIKRYGLFNPIVAVRDPNDSPDCAFPKIENLPPRFRIDRLINGGPNRDVIGYVDLSQSTEPQGISVCPDYIDPIYPWKTNFNLIPLFSPKAFPPQNCDGNKWRDNDYSDNIQIWTNNPFSSELLVGKLGSSLCKEDLSVQLFNNYGLICKSQYLKMEDELVEFHTENLPSGLYFLQVTGSGIFYTQCLIKL